MENPFWNTRNFGIKSKTRMGNKRRPLTNSKCQVEKGIFEGYYTRYNYIKP